MITRAEAERLREQLLAVLAEDVRNTELLLSRLDSIMKETGIGAHAALLLILTHLAFEDGEARRHWEAVLEHRQRISEALRRDVGVRVAVLDYFLNVNRRLVRPTLIELEMYEAPYPVDPLTGLASDRMFRAAVQNETRRAKRYRQRVSVALFDLDDFSGVNEAVGELVADRLLKEAAIVLHNKVRDIDVVARPGEDELAVVLPETDRNGALLAAERFRREVESHFSYREAAGRRVHLTVSGGVASYPEDAGTPETLLEHAARALYQAKASGKNTIHVYHAERRRFLRVDLWAGHFEVEVLSPRKMSAGHARNLSPNGIVFTSFEALNVGEEIEIRVVSATGDAVSRSPRLRGRVVRLEELPDVSPQPAGAATPQDPLPDRFEIGMALDLDSGQGEQNLMEFLEKARTGGVGSRS